MSGYFLLSPAAGKAISLTLPAAAPLLLAPLNPLDKIQHWRLSADAVAGNFIHSRNDDNLVFDVTNGVFVEGNPVSVYGLKTLANTNQRFFFTSPGNITVVDPSKLNVVALSDTKIALSATGQTFTAIPAPPDYAVTLNNATKGPVTFSYANAPASEATSSWTVPAGGTAAVTVPSGATLVAKDATGKVLAPTPYQVAQAGTLTINDVPVASIVFYDGPNLTGRSLPYTVAEPNLGTVGWNDLPNSFQVISGTWIIYQDYFTGSKIVANPRGGLNLDGIYNVGTWGGYPGTVVGISSFRPLPQDGLVLFNSFNFENTIQLNVNSDIPDLTALNFAQLTNSLVVLSGVWELWDRIGFQGSMRLVSVDGGRDGTGWYSIPQQWGGRANAILSVRRH